MRGTRIKKTLYGTPKSTQPFIPLESVNEEVTACRGRGLVHRPQHLPTQDLRNGDEHCPISDRL